MLEYGLDNFLFLEFGGFDFDVALAHDDVDLHVLKQSLQVVV